MVGNSGLAILVSLLAAVACSKSSDFSGNSTQKEHKPTILVPGGEGLARITPLPYTEADKPKVCAQKQLATRIAFIIDNSKSHARTTDAVGSDPVKTALSVRGIREEFTQRQNAVYGSIIRTTEREAEAIKTSTEFLASDVGVVYFPRGGATREDYDSYATVSGPGGLGAAALPTLMSSLRKITPNDSFKEALWQSFGFTHAPNGATPYLTALNGAKNLLDTTRVAGDPRKEMVIMITDGLPTDESPKAVIDFAQAQFKAKGVVFMTFFVYTPGVVDMKDTPAYAMLKAEFENNGWGKDDGYTKFDDYWNALVAIPGKISDHLVQVADSTKLKEKIDEITGVVQACE